MTGREYIQYILENHLEDEKIIKDDRLVGFLTLIETANKFDVGVETIRAWIVQGRLDSVDLLGVMYVPANAEVKLGPLSPLLKEAKDA